MAEFETAASVDSGHVILKEAAVTAGGRCMMLKLSSNNLQLTDGASEISKSKGFCLPWIDIISATTSKKFKGNNATKGLSIHYMQLQSNKKLQAKVYDILLKDDTADSWIAAVKEQCALVKSRPKRLFVIVNPLSGSSNGRQIFEKKVQPFFDMAEIELDVHITERAKHGLELAETQDFSAYDGIVVLGGDGSYHEVLLGLTLQTQRSAGVDYEDVNATLKPLTTPIGIIPVGTGNGLSGWINGTIDVETSVLKVVRGEQQRASAFKLYSCGKFLTMSGLLIGYGFFTDLIRRTDELRWMKKARYGYALFAFLFGKKRRWQCSLEYQLLPDDTDKKDTVTHNEKSTDTPDEKSTEALDEKREEASNEENKETGSGDSVEDSGATATNGSPWIKYDGKTLPFTGVFTFLANMVGNGERLYPEVSSKQFSLYVDHGSSNIPFMVFFAKHIFGRRNLSLPANLEIINNITGFRINVTQDPTETNENVTIARARPRELEHMINVDGELKTMDVPDLEMRVIHSFVPVFGANPWED